MALTPSTMAPLSTQAPDFRLPDTDGRQPSPEQTPSMGCNIKWRPGNEPAY